MHELIKRASAGFVYVVLLLFCEIYSYETFLALFALFLIISLFEYSKLVKTPYAINLILGCLIFIYVNKYNQNNSTHLILAIISSLVCLYGVYVLFSSKEHLSKFEKYLFLFGYIIFPFILISKIPLTADQYNPRILIGIFILTWTQDTFAFLVGKTLGKTKLYEKISPKKTIEGFLGGCFFTIVAALLIGKYFLADNMLIWFFIAILICIFGTLGDLFESKLKRIAQVKDSGKIMPGHGGILDRLDSIIFVTPFVYITMLIFNYVS